MFAQSMAHVVTMQQNPAVWSAAANNLAAVLPYSQPIPAHGYAAVGWDGSSYAMPPTMPHHYYPVHHMYQQHGGHVVRPSGGDAAPVDQQQLLRQLQELALGNERPSAVFQSDSAVGQQSQHAVSEQPSAALLAALGHGITSQSGLGVPPLGSGSDLARGPGLEMGLGAGHVQPQGAESFQASAALRAVAAAAAAAALARVSEQGGAPPLADQLPELSELTGGVGVAIAASSLPGSDAILGCKQSLLATDLGLGSRSTCGLSRGSLLARSLADTAKEAAQRPKRDVMLASALAALSRNGSADLSPTIPAGWHTDHVGVMPTVQQGVEDVNVASLTQAGSVFGMLPRSTAVQPSTSLATSLLGSAAAPVRQPSPLVPLHMRLAQEVNSSIASGVQTPLSADGAMTTVSGVMVGRQHGTVVSV